MRTFIRSIAFATVVGMLAASAPAALISAVGLDTTTQANWRTTPTAVPLVLPKPLDLDGDNVYGTAGYFAFSTGNTMQSGITQPFQAASDKDGYPADLVPSLASWLTLTANGANGDFSGGYNMIDDPTLPPGSSVADINSGYAFKTGVVANTYTSLFNLNFGPGTPTGPIRIGIMLNVGSGVVNGMRLVDSTNLTQTVGNTQLVGSTSGSFPNYAFFNVTHAANGDVVTIQGNYAAGGSDGISGITLDLPEPTSVGILAAGALCALVRRRRQVA